MNTSTNPFRLHPNTKWGTVAFFILLHLLPLSLFWIGVETHDLIAAFILYLLMGFGITAGYHRYFAHRTYQTNRFFQFILAILGSLTFQRILPWAAQHRHHHRTSDTEEDLHSPIRGLLWSHLLWMFRGRDYAAIIGTVPDLSRYPELRWINRWCYLVPGVAIAICYTIGGWSMVIGGFVLAVIFTWHIMLSINSLTHLMGSRRYVTTDTSRNSLLLALLAFGEGWHNNHHYYSTSTRQGFRWWEVDLSYYLLKLFSFVGLVRRMRSIPTELAGRNLVSQGTFDIGEALAEERRMQFLQRPRLISIVLSHTISIAGATTLVTLLIVFSSLRGNPYLIVGSSIFGVTLLTFFILHVWKIGLNRNNLYLLIGGALTPLLVLFGRITPWAWMILAGMWVMIGAVILARFMRARLGSLELAANLSVVLTAIVPLLFFWQAGFVATSSLLLGLMGISIFALAYRYRYAFEVLRLQPLFQLVLLAGSTSYFFFLNGLIQ